MSAWTFWNLSWLFPKPLFLMRTCFINFGGIQVLQKSMWSSLNIKIQILFCHNGTKMKYFLHSCHNYIYAVQNSSAWLLNCSRMWAEIQFWPQNQLTSTNEYVPIWFWLDLNASYTVQCNARYRMIENPKNLDAKMQSWRPSNSWNDRFWNQA